MHTNLVDWFYNVCFWSPFLAWMIAQAIKMVTNYIDTKQIDLYYFVSTGGMPSAHSAMVSGLATAVGLREGFDTSIFALAFGFALLVMFDASTVRRAAGMQARILNEMIRELFKEHKLSEHKLAELLGHTRLEVFMGMVVGILVAMLVVSCNAVK